MMAKEKFDYERIEWIPPSWAETPGTYDSVIAYSVLPKESIYIMKRFQPARQVDIWNKKTEEYRAGLRRTPLQWFMEIRDHEGVRVLRKHRLIAEEAFVEWQDADNQVMDFESAFPGLSELLVMKRDNPISYDEAAKRFWHGEKGKAHNVTSTGDELYSYGTVIMQRLPDGKVIANLTPYSSSTSGHQSAANRHGQADYIVHGVSMGAYDLRPALERKLLIATSNVGRERIDIVMVRRRLPITSYSDYGIPPFAYYREIYSPRGINSLQLTPKLAYIEYLDADRRTMPFNEAFPDNPELASMKRKYPNPSALGKRHYFYPFTQWHHSGTKLLAQSIVKTRRGNLGINLYRTAQGRYFLETGLDLGGQWGEAAGQGHIQYIPRRRALVEFRDADKRLVTNI